MQEGYHYGAGYSPPPYPSPPPADYGSYATPSTGDPNYSSYPPPPHDYSAGYSAPAPAFSPPSYGTAPHEGAGYRGYEAPPSGDYGHYPPQQQTYGSDTVVVSTEAYGLGSNGGGRAGQSGQSYGSGYGNAPSNSDHLSSSLGSMSLYPVSAREDSSFDSYKSRGGGSYAAEGGSSYGGQILRYDGGGDEPYGARGTSGSSQLISIVDPATARASSGRGSSYGRAAPADVVEGPNGVQRFRVKLLAEEGSSASPQDVLCQVGLDGVRLLEPSSQRMLRIYPLETITRWAVREPSVFTFWAKNSADFEQKAVRLSSNSATTNSILDALTAACVQLCEMIGKDGPSGGHNPAAATAGNAAAAASAVANAPPATRAASFVGSILRKAPEQELREHWVPDVASKNCTACGTAFTAFNRRHHCRNCGDIFCDGCTKGRIALTADEGAQPVRVCDRCLAEVTQRLQNSTSVVKPAAAPRSHEDLAKKLQEEMERNKPRSAPTSTPPASSSSSGGGGTQVITCSSCGTVNLSNGRDTRCSACGADASRAAPQRQSWGGRNSAYALDGPPHLWAGNTGGQRSRDVACPTCTVHLTVNVPSHGTETVECNVCQHPFLVGA